MTYCHCEAIEYHFDRPFAEARLRRYKREGPHIATQIMVKVLKEQNLVGARLLDIGGGVGTVMHELMPVGIERAILVESSSAYIAVAEAEALRRGYREAVKCEHGDFVELAARIPVVDLVTLDRVVCCYPEMKSLIEASLAKSVKWYALSYPRERWYVRLDDAYKNWRRRRRGNPFRTYVHSEQLIEKLIEKAGFCKYFRRATWMWNVSVYRRIKDT